MKLPNKKIVIGLIFLIAIYFGSKYFFTSSSSAPTYQIANAEKGSLIINLSTSGSVAATNSRTVTTTASGVVKKVYVKEGQAVRTGTPIMLIELDLNGTQKLSSAYSSYLSAQNSYKSTQDKIYSLQSDLVSAKNIFDNQWAGQSPNDPTYIQKHNALLSAQAAYDNLQNSLRQASSALESARLSYQMASATVYAPISGTVSAISLASGMILNPTSDTANSSNVANKIAIVKTSATPAISVSLTETDVTKVKVGQKATITLDALPEKTYTGKVIAVDTSGTVSSGVVSYTTTIQLDTNVDEILSNMSATASIITDIVDDAILVPSSAVVTVNGQTVVRQLINKVLTNIEVQVGKSNGTLTQIISGINDEDSVVTSITTPSTTSKSTTGTSVFSSPMGSGSRIGR
ncbi:MAG: efflux RND transporter periplasmic adaptor subunit [Microgenomates group bacterium]